MSTYKEIQDVYVEYTDKTSQSVRASAVSGLIAVWIVSNTTRNPSALLYSHLHTFEIAAMLFIVALAFDLLHNFVGSIVFWRYVQNLYQDYKDKPEELNSKDFEYPFLVTTIPWIFFFLKATTLTVATFVLCFAVITSL